jgi:hypothetical protein
VGGSSVEHSRYGAVKARPRPANRPVFGLKGGVSGMTRASVLGRISHVPRCPIWAHRPGLPAIARLRAPLFLHQRGMVQRLFLRYSAPVDTVLWGSK